MNTKGATKQYVVGFDDMEMLGQTGVGVGGHELLPNATYTGLSQFFEPELTYIINKYSLPRGLNSTKKLVEVTDSEQIFLEEQRR